MSELWRDNWQDWPEGSEPPPGPKKSDVEWMLQKVQKSGNKATFNYVDRTSVAGIDGSWKHKGVLTDFHVRKYQNPIFQGCPSFELRLKFGGSSRRANGLSEFADNFYGMNGNMSSANRTYLEIIWKG